jgi:hypothetical protein
MLGKGSPKSSDVDEFEKKHVPQDAIDISMHQSLHEVSRLHGLRVVGDANWTHNISSMYVELLILILEHMLFVR